MRRAKSLSLLGVALAGVLGLLAGSQTWVTFLLDGAADAEAVTGYTLNSALSPISIALIAAALALTIAGKIFRRVLGGVVALLGAGYLALTAGVIAAPLSAAGGRITELTGIAGGSSGSLVLSSSVSAWVWVGVVAGVLAIVVGVFVTILGGRWAAAGRKYDGAATPTGGAGGETGPDRISDWDALTGGDDPTSP